jgi:hypothetical protein
LLGACEDSGVSGVLTGRLLFSGDYPALKRRAIFGSPCGTVALLARGPGLSEFCGEPKLGHSTWGIEFAPDDIEGTCDFRGTAVGEQKRLLVVIVVDEAMDFCFGGDGCFEN